MPADTGGVRDLEGQIVSDTELNLRKGRERLSTP